MASASIGSFEPIFDISRDFYDRKHAQFKEFSVSEEYACNLWHESTKSELYTSCGSLPAASKAFREIYNPTQLSWNAIINIYAKHEKGELALQLYDHMVQGGRKPNKYTFPGVLKACGNMMALEQGRCFHMQIMDERLQSDTVVGSTIVNMYFKCGNLEEAHRAFSKLLTPSVISWNTMIMGYVHHGDNDLALDCFDRMQHERVNPDRVTFLGILKACTTIEQGRHIHEHILDCLLQSDIMIESIMIESTLVDMYARRGSLKESSRVFYKMSTRNVVSWNIIIAGYVMNGEGRLALECFEYMKYEHIKPSKATFLSILKACGNVGTREQGRCIHEKILDSGIQFDIMVGSTLVDMYAKCASLEEACKIFSKLPTLNVVSWAAMIAGYVQHGEGHLALDCFDSIHTVAKADMVIYINTLKACGSMCALHQCRRIHEHIVENSLQFDIMVGNTLIDSYANCGSLEEANRIFCSLRSNSIVLWGAMIKGYAHNGEGCRALECFSDMQHEGMKPDRIIFLSILKACGCMNNAIEPGRCIHEMMFASDLQFDTMIGSTLVDMYAKCGSLEEARGAFDNLPDQNLVSWNTMIAGYVQHDEGLLALDCFASMQCNRINPDKVTFLSLLKTCAGLGVIEQGRCMHELIIESGFQNNVILRNILVDMYAKCGNLEEACQSFRNLSNRNVSSWNTIIAVYAQYGIYVLAFRCFVEMRQDGLNPSIVTYLNILKACGSIGAVALGRYIHEQIIDNGLLDDIVLGSAVVDMYAKFGSLEEAAVVFRKLSSRNVVSWGAMIVGYAQAGDAGLAVQCFDDMQLDNIKPDDLACNGILNALSHVGLVDEGLKYLRSMRDSHNIEPNLYHINCVIDLLGCAGLFNEAKLLLEACNIKGSSCLWMTLLNACRMHGNVELGRQCFNKLILLNPSSSAAYFLMADCLHMYQGG